MWVIFYNKFLTESTVRRHMQIHTVKDEVEVEDERFNVQSIPRKRRRGKKGLKPSSGNADTNEEDEASKSYNEYE